MLHQELQDQFRGSFLKKQYLEAFAIQSAYIEGLITLYYDLKFTIELDMSTGPKALLNQYTKTFNRRVKISDIVSMLAGAQLITLEQKNELLAYQDKRNATLHKLLQEFHRSEFETDLKETYELGDKLIGTDKFKKIISLVDFMEKDRQGASSSNEKNSSETIQEFSVNVPGEVVDKS